MLKRRIVLDTETTGLEVDAGHRIIEIGCIELRNRRFTGNELSLCIDSDASMNVANRKNMTSIMGMISMRPRRAVLDLRRFIEFLLLLLLIQTDVIDQSGTEPLHLIQRLRLTAREVIEPE